MSTQLSFPSTYLGSEKRAQPRNAPLGVGQVDARGYRVVRETVAADGALRRRLLLRPAGGQPYHAQRKINAFNFPFTGNPGLGCWFQCSYCYLRQPFFQNLMSADHGKEMSVLPDFPEQTRRFLDRHAQLPQYMKRVQLGVSTELFMPQVLEWSRLDLALLEFQRAATAGNVWMLHLVTKSPVILRFADLLAEMREQVQVEVSLVSLDETTARHFEPGVPSVAARLNIIETLAAKGVFVRLMLMPSLREYEFRVVDGRREILFAHQHTGETRPGKKTRPGDVVGNRGAGEPNLVLHDGSLWAKVSSADWHPVVRRDWSRLDLAQAAWRDLGSSAYKQKDLNYYHVDELLRARHEKRSPRPERGRAEDDTAEYLVRSGETARDASGREQTVLVRAYNLPRSQWDGSDAPEIDRRVMNFGYALHSPIHWGDCI